MPKGFRTEDGPRPDFAELYGMVEIDTQEYPPRTRANVGDSGGTPWFGNWHSPGGRLTLDSCREMMRPFFLVHQGITRPSVEAFLGRVFRGDAT